MLEINKNGMLPIKRLNVHFFRLVSIFLLLLFTLLGKLFAQDKILKKYFYGSFQGAAWLPVNSGEYKPGISGGAGLEMGLQLEHFFVEFSFHFGIHSLSEGIPVFEDTLSGLAENVGVGAVSINIGHRFFFSRRHDMGLSIGLGSGGLGYSSQNFSVDNFPTAEKWALVLNTGIDYKRSSTPKEGGILGKEKTWFWGIGFKYIHADFRLQDTRNPQFTGNLILLTLQFGTKDYSFLFGL
ncbi:MAG: hypothetical protein AAFP70_00695 [Calditrichota bacterium]